jgi:hypothetical protein
MTIAVKFMFAALLLQRARNELLMQDQRKQWVGRMIEDLNNDS